MRICKLLLATVLGLVFAAGLAHAQTAEIAATVTDQQGRPVVDAVLVAVPVDGNLRSPQNVRAPDRSTRSTRSSSRESPSYRSGRR